MTNHLIPFLREVVNRVTAYGSVINFVHLKEQPNGTLLAKASATDGSVHFSSTSTQCIDLEGSRACLGNLSYLNQLLNSSMTRGGQESVEVRAQDRNGVLITSSLVFRPNPRTEMVYVTTDPFRASITKPKALVVDHWPVMFMWDIEAIKEFTEIKRIHAAAPSTGREDIVTLSARHDSITLEFGGNVSSHSTSMVMNVPVEMDDSGQVFNVSVNSDQLLKGIMQSQDDEKTVEARLAEKAIQLAVKTEHGTHELTIVHRKTKE